MLLAVPQVSLLLLATVRAQHPQQQPPTAVATGRFSVWSNCQTHRVWFITASNRHEGWLTDL